MYIIYKMFQQILRKPDLLYLSQLEVKSIQNYLFILF